MAEEKDFIIVLFKTLKEAIQDMNLTLKDMLNNQKTIGTYMETLPIKELKDSLKEHNKEANDSIDECTDVVNLQSKDIIAEITFVKNLIIRSIVIVTVFFGIVSSGWFYKSFIQEPSEPHDKLEETIIELKQSLDDEKEKNDSAREKQTKIIDELRRTITGLHKKAE